MERITSLLLASLLFCLQLTQHCIEAYWARIPSKTGTIREWKGGVLSDDVPGMDTFNFYPPIEKSSTTAPGTYNCMMGDDYTITSENYPSDYPAKSRLRWIFKTDGLTMIKFHCPVIRIHPSKRCKKDKLAIFTGKRFIRGVRRCGRINDVRYQTEDNLKISFKSNNDIKTGNGFVCNIKCVAVPTSTTTPVTSTTTTSSTSTTSVTSTSTSSSTTTTTFSPNCPNPTNPPSVLTPVASCSDIPAEYSSVCTCTDCSGKMELSCDFCSRCEFDIFAVLDFSLDIVVSASFSCATDPIDITGWFFHNADNIVGMRLCIEDDLSTISIPYSEYTNLATLAYQDCSNSAIDICSVSRRRRSVDKSLRPSTRSTYSVTLPAAADVPNVVNLYLYDIDMTLDNTVLTYTNLQMLMVDSTSVTISANAFSNLGVIETLSVTMCNTEIEADEFKITATSLQSLTIDDTCVHTIDNEAIKFDGLSRRQLRTSTGVISLDVTASSTFFEYIPQCPFRQLLELDCVSLTWNTEVKCRNCGGHWYWSLTSQEMANVTATCYDTVSTSSMDLDTYVDNNSNPCGFTIPFTSCY